MAIKIKNRDKEPEETPEEEGGLPATGAAGSGLDGLERTTFLAANWVEENRSKIFGSIIVVVVVIVGALIVLQFVRGQQVEASSRLSQGLSLYQVPVEGSPELEQMRAQEEIPDPPKIFGSEEEKWEAIYTEAANTLRDFDRGPIASSARFTKAAAALNLGRGDEAEALYREVIASNDAPQEFRTFSRMGLANSLALQGDIDGALEAWSAFAAADPDRRAYADFEAARLVARQGDSERARALYEAFLEEHPASEFRSDVERRLALL